MLETLAPFEKAALFVVSLGRYIGPEVLARLAPGELELLRMGLTALGRTRTTDIEILHRDFYESYSSADYLRLPVFAYLRGFLRAHSGDVVAERIIDEVAVDTRSLSEPLSVEHDRKFLFDFIRELEEARSRIFPESPRFEDGRGPVLRASPVLWPAARAVQRQPVLAARILRCWLSGVETFRPAGREEHLNAASRLALLLRALSPLTAALLVRDADEAALRELVFWILSTEDLAPPLRQAVLLETTELLLQHGLIPGPRETRAREFSRLLRGPAWLADLLRDMAEYGALEIDSGQAPRFPGEITMRRELARACSHAVRHRPEAVSEVLALHF